MRDDGNVKFSRSAEKTIVRNVQLFRTEFLHLLNESSDEEFEDSTREVDSTLLQGEIESSATFLIGARTRYGRAVRFNNRPLHGT